MIFPIVLALLTTCATALPVIFGYHNEEHAEADRTARDHVQKLFVAGVNKSFKRPMSIHGDAVAYNVDEKDLPNFIPAPKPSPQPAPTSKAESEQQELPHDIHPSYKEIVTRSTRTHFDLDAVSSETDGKLEACYGNVKLLSRRVVRKMNRRRRRLAQNIRRLNKLQRTYCLSRRVADERQAKCPIWRAEKMSLYVKLMQLTHCAGPRAQR